MIKKFRKVNNPKNVRSFNLNDVKETDLQNWGWIRVEEAEKVIKDKEETKPEPKKEEPKTESKETPEENSPEIPDLTKKEDTKPAAKKTGRKPKKK